MFNHLESWRQSLARRIWPKSSNFVELDQAFQHESPAWPRKAAKSFMLNYKNIVADLDSKSNIQTDLSKELERALKASKRRTFLYKVGTIVGGAATLLLLVQK